MRRLRNVPGIFIAAAILVIAVSAGAEAKRKVVVELFTSQGCDSCPPADALLARLADRKDILALSLPITYWDMLGWKDTLASEENTRRQKAYAAAMGRGGIYTPQMIVDGTGDVVGSREVQVEAAIAARIADMREIPVTLTTTTDTVHIVIAPGAARGSTDATVWLFYILSRASVHIAGGENQGRMVTYRNVVRDVRAIAVWKGEALSLDLPRRDLIGPSHDAIAVVLQERGYGRVIGEASLGPPEFGPPL